MSGRRHIAFLHTYEDVNITLTNVGVDTTRHGTFLRSFEEVLCDHLSTAYTIDASPQDVRKILCGEKPDDLLGNLGLSDDAVAEARQGALLLAAGRVAFTALTNFNDLDEERPDVGVFLASDSEHLINDAVQQAIGFFFDRDSADEFLVVLDRAVEGGLLLWAETLADQLTT